MTRHPTWLAEYRCNVYSQSGEDGVVEQALSLLPNRDLWCVEFGAWDGHYLSNVRNLIQNHDYSALLIEGDPGRFEDLRRNFARASRVHTANRFVGFQESDNLDTILESTPVPRDFDFLSIDIDGNDYHVWKAMTRYRPKLICVEFNPTIPTEVDFVQCADPRVQQGSSLSAFVRLGKEKGYEPVCVLPFNAFFVRSDYFPAFGIENNHPSVLRTDLSYVTYIFSGYDGQLFLAGRQMIPWHGLRLAASSMQPLPHWLRRFPGSFRPYHKPLRNLHRWWSGFRAGVRDRIATNRVPRPAVLQVTLPPASCPGEPPLKKEAA